MGELKKVNFEFFIASKIDDYNDKKDIKKDIIDKLPKQHNNFNKQILPYIEQYLNNDILDIFFKNTLKTPITKIYSSHNFNVKRAIAAVTTQNSNKITKILNIINNSSVFTNNPVTNPVTNRIHNSTSSNDFEISGNLVKSDSPFITAFKNYILNLTKLLKLLQDNEDNIKNIYALANNQRIRVASKSSNHKLLPKESKYYSDTNVTAKELENIEKDDTWAITKFKNSLFHFGNDITLNNLKEELKLFQTAYGNIKTFINGSDKYSIKDIKTYIDGIKKSQTELIASLEDINGKFDYTAENPNSSIFIAKIDFENNIYENILNLLRDITANKALLEQINDSKKRIKINRDHRNEKDVKVIDLVEATRDIEIDKQLKAFNNSQFSTSALSTVSTSFENIKSKLPAYLNNIIIIIIFLIFLNLFITTYFYFTTSIQATANRSNCGGASLCEAETHRHLFLEDNGNDKARDIYIIIVVIFSIYLLYEIFKSYKDGIDFTDITSNYIFRKNIVILCFIASVILIELAKFYFVSYDPDYSNHFDMDMDMDNLSGWKLRILDGADGIMSSIILGISFLIFCIGVIHLLRNLNEKREEYTSTEVYSIYIALFIMLGIILGYAIFKLVIPKYQQKNRYGIFKIEQKDSDGILKTSSSDENADEGFASTNFNSKFKAKTAIDIILITFYGICILVFGFGLIQQYKGNNYDITLYVIALSLLAILLVTLYIFILNSSVDWSRPDNKDNYDRYFEFFRPCLIVVGFCPGLLAFMFKSEQNIIKLIVFYYAILFIIYLFYVYFINHNNESGILSLAYFQLYNYFNINKNKTKKGSVNKNYYKEFNQINVYFVVALLIILIGIGGLNEDPNLDNIIYGIIVFILASYITGVVYLLYNELFPIQQASFDYKKNLVAINNEISQHIKVEEVEHTIDKNKIRVFKIANEKKDIEDIHKRINSERKDGTTGKEKHMKNIRDIFSEISPKGSSYEDYRSQSTDQMQYEEYIYRLFSVWQGPNMFDFETTYNGIIFRGQIITDSEKNVNVYNNIITKLPKNENDLENLRLNGADGAEKLLEKKELIKDLFKIPKANNIEYVIKKNYKYVTGEEGKIQKYNVLSDTELDCLYYKEVSTATAVENNKKLEESIRYIKNINATELTITNIATVTTYPEIYKLNQDIFDYYKSKHTIGDIFITLKDNKKYQNISYSNIIPTSYEKLNPAFYTIGYDYENYTYKADNHQQMNKDTAYSIPARYYACSYLNYFPNEDGSMSKVKFAKNIKEDNYNPLNTKNTIIDRIAERYNENAKETKIQLAPEKFQFLLVFLVVLAIILLMFLFNIIKKYFTGDVYTPQMYVLGILGVFLTIFIFGEVIFARIK